MKRIFLDANVLFTAAYNPGGLAAALITRQKQFHILVKTSRYAVEEADHNLSLKSPDALSRFRELPSLVEILDEPFQEDFNPLNLPADDAPIFQSALASGATHLLTGDKKAFGPWMDKPSKTSGLVIQTVRQFFDSQPASGHRRLGSLRGKIQVRNDFDQWPDDVAKSLGLRDP